MINSMILTAVSFKITISSTPRKTPTFLRVGILSCRVNTFAKLVSSQPLQQGAQYAVVSDISFAKKFMIPCD